MSFVLSETWNFIKRTNVNIIISKSKLGISFYNAILTPLNWKKTSATIASLKLAAKAPEKMTGPKKEKDHFPRINFQVRTVSFREGISASFLLSELFRCFFWDEKLIFAHIDRFLTVLWIWLPKVFQCCFFHRKKGLKTKGMKQSRRWVFPAFFVWTFSVEPRSHAIELILYLDVPARKWSDQWVFSPTYKWGILRL